MKPTTLSVFATLATLSACHRDDHPPARPTVQPEHRAVDAGAARAVPAPPPPPVEGPCALEVAGGAEITALRGRIDNLQIAAAGDRARVVAEVTTGRDTRVTRQVDVDPAGTASAPEDLSVGVRRGRVAAAPVAVDGAMQTVKFGMARGISPEEFGSSQIFVAGPRVSTQHMITVGALVTASDGPSWIAATIGDTLDCYGPACDGDDRETSGLRFHPRSGYQVSLVAPRGNELAVSPVASVACADPTRYAVDDEGVMYDPADQPAPGDRCGAVRAQRPTDVAVAVRGARGMLVWRSARMLEFARVDPTNGTLGAQPARVTGEVGAPSIAIRGDTLLAVWAQRTGPRAPYVLQALSWNLATDAVPPAARPLATGALSAFAPAVAVRGDAVVVAWMEGDERTAQVRVGATHGDLTRVIEHAVTISAAQSNSRDPELAVAGDRVWLAWSEYPGGRPRATGAARVSPLRLP